MLVPLDVVFIAAENVLVALILLLAYGRLRFHVLRNQAHVPEQFVGVDNPVDFFLWEPEEEVFGMLLLEDMLILILGNGIQGFKYFSEVSQRVDRTTSALARLEELFGSRIQLCRSL